MPPKLPIRVPSRGEFQYRELALAPIHDWGWDLKDFKSDCLRKTVEVFHWNLIRTSTFALMPAWIALEAIREQLWVDHAMVKEGRALDPDLTKLTEETYSSETEAEFNRLVMQYRQLPDKTIKKLLDEIGIHHIENHIDVSRGLSVGVELVFESVIKDSWTAFETLASELWAATLDKDNGTINALVAPVLRRPHKKVKPQFNIRTHPGSYQVEMRQVMFQKVDDIERLYETAFPHRVTQLFKNVEGGYITVLAAYRNVFVHKRGKVDQQFQEHIKDFDEFNRIPLGEDLLLNGALVKRMRDAAIELGRKLVVVADEALQSQI